MFNYSIFFGIVHNENASVGNRPNSLHFKGLGCYFIIIFFNTI